MDPESSVSYVRVCISEFYLRHGDGSVEKIDATDKVFKVNSGSYTWGTLKNDVQDVVPGQHLIICKEMGSTNADELVFQTSESKITVHALVGNRVVSDGDPADLTKKRNRPNHTPPDQLCGLTNAMNNCYANAGLQCFMATEPFVRYISGTKASQECTLESCFTCSMRAHIQKCLKHPMPFYPEQVLKHVNKFPGDFAGCVKARKMCDAVELVGEMINVISSSNSNYHPNNKTAMEDIFSGHISIERECVECGEKMLNEEMFLTMSVPITDEKYVCAKSLEDCIDFYKQSSITAHCKRCKADKVLKKQDRIFFGPNYLIIHLKRAGRDEVKSEAEISCCMELDMTPYMVDCKNKTIYTLYAAITHEGPNTKYGHYISFAKYNQDWFKINDSRVVPVTTNSVRKELDKGAYALFYRKMGETSTPADEQETEQGSPKRMVSNDEQDTDDEQETDDEQGTEQEGPSGLLSKLNKEFSKQGLNIPLGDMLHNLRTHGHSKSAGLAKKYIIAEDRPREDVMKRIQDAMKYCDLKSKKEKYEFRVPVGGRFVYDKELRQICRPDLGRDRKIFGSEGTKEMGTKVYAILKEIKENFKKKFRVMDQRFIYYKYKREFEWTMGQFNTALNIVVLLIRTTRLSLRISNPKKGQIVGPLEMYVNRKVRIDCSDPEGADIPYDAHEINNIVLRRKVKFILIVEKATIFRMLLQIKFHEKYDCIVITGKGFPDIATKAVAHKLSEQLPAVPVYGLADYNPDGALILFNFKYGSRQRAYDNLDLTVPRLKWIGIIPHHLYDLRSESEDAFELDPSMFPQLTELDLAKLKNLIVQMPLCPRETALLQQMEDQNFKADIESLLTDVFTIEEYLAALIPQMDL